MSGRCDVHAVVHWRCPRFYVLGHVDYSLRRFFFFIDQGHNDEQQLAVPNALRKKEKSSCARSSSGVLIAGLQNLWDCMQLATSTPSLWGNCSWAKHLSLLDFKTPREGSTIVGLSKQASEGHVLSFYTVTTK